MVQIKLYGRIGLRLLPLLSFFFASHPICLGIFHEWNVCNYACQWGETSESYPQGAEPIDVNLLWETFVLVLMDCYFYLSLLDMDRHTTPDRNRLRRPARELPVDPISSVYRSSVRGMIIQPFASQNDSLIIKLFHTFAFRVASMPNTGVEEEYYRLRHFSITGKGIVNRGDSLKSRRSRSNNSVASSNSRLVNERERKDFSLFAYSAWKLLMFFFLFHRSIAFVFFLLHSKFIASSSILISCINKFEVIVDCRLFKSAEQSASSQYLMGRSVKKF